MRGGGRGLACKSQHIPKVQVSLVRPDPSWRSPKYKHDFSRTHQETVTHIRLYARWSLLAIITTHEWHTVMHAESCPSAGTRGRHPCNKRTMKQQWAGDSSSFSATVMLNCTGSRESSHLALSSDSVDRLRCSNSRLSGLHACIVEIISVGTEERSRTRNEQWVCRALLGIGVGTP